jgi:ABC-type transporter Mla MlaB component
MDPLQASVTVRLSGELARSELPAICERVSGLLERACPPVIYCEVAGVAVDAVTVDALGQLQLLARRYGCTLKLRDVSDELRELIEWAGLQRVLAE